MNEEDKQNEIENKRIELLNKACEGLTFREVVGMIETFKYIVLSSHYFPRETEHHIVLKKEKE